MIEMIMKIAENYLIPAEWPVMLFFGVPGFVLFVGGCVMGLRRYALYRHGVTTQGRVVEAERHEHSSKDEEGRRTTSVSYHLMIEFATAGGAKHRFTADMSLSTYGIGSTVRVLYDPKDPSNARIAELAAWKFWAEPLFYGLSGFLVVGFCIGLFFFYQQQMISDHTY